MAQHKRKTEMTKTVETRVSVLITSEDLIALLRRELNIPEAVRDLTVETEGGGSYCGEDINLEYAAGIRVTWKVTTTEEASF